jgi:hypothetical protein
VERGTHLELLKRDEKYTSLRGKQVGGVLRWGYCSTSIQLKHNHLQNKIPPFNPNPSLPAPIPPTPLTPLRISQHRWHVRRSLASLR